MKRGRKKLVHKDVESRLEGTGLHWVGRYSGSQVKVRFGCDAHGHEWDALPSSVFRGSGCPGCYSMTTRGHENGWSGARIRERENVILEDYGEWLMVDISTPSFPKISMLIDRADFDLLKKTYSGRIVCGAYGYPVMRANGKIVAVHRTLMDEAKQVDHIDQVKTNNRRSNLRSVEAWQNMANRGLVKTNKTGIIGVSWVERDKLFRVQLSKRKRIVHQSLHKTLEEAAAARAKAVAEHCGEFAPILAK